MTARRAIRHLDKVIRDRGVAPVELGLPAVLFGTQSEPTALSDDAVCVTHFDGPLANMKLAEWGCAPVESSLAGIGLAGFALGVAS